MTGWALFWWIIVTAALATYFGLAILVTVGGFYDMKRMFRRLNEAATRTAPVGRDAPPTPTEAVDRESRDE